MAISLAEAVVGDAVSSAAEAVVGDALSSAAAAVSGAAEAAEQASKGGQLSMWLPILIGVILVLAVCAVVVIMKTRRPVDLGPQTSEGNAILTCSGGSLAAPVSGSVMPRERIPDETFSSGYLGEGVGIIPSAETVSAPCSGTITSVEKTGHALQMKTDSRMEILIHVGIDTLDMKGDGFECFVKKGDRVETGQALITFSREKIEKAGHSDCVVVLLTNASDFSGIKAGV